MKTVFNVAFPQKTNYFSSRPCADFNLRPLERGARTLSRSRQEASPNIELVTA